MKIIILLSVFIGNFVSASEKPQEIEVCKQVSEIDPAFFCSFGDLQAIHFKGQPAQIIQMSKPTPTPSATSVAAPVKDGKK